MVRTLTLEDRWKIELMWWRNASPVKIAAELEIGQCTVYAELKRGQETDGASDVVLDENFRPAYSAERGGNRVSAELAECQRQAENVDFRRNGMSFFGCQHSGVYIPHTPLHLPA